MLKIKSTPGLEEGLGSDKRERKPPSPLVTPQNTDTSDK